MEDFWCGAYYDRIGSNIRRIRTERGMTQEQLAEKTDLSLTAVQKLEAGRSGSRIETLLRIAIALHVSLDTLAGICGAGEKYGFCHEAAYKLLEDKSDDEIRYAIAVVDSMFRYKKQFLDK